MDSRKAKGGALATNANQHAGTHVHIHARVHIHVRIRRNTHAVCVLGFLLTSLLRKKA